MVDTHAHLGLCEPDDGELVAAAVEAGVTRILTVGIDVAASRDAIAEVFELRGAQGKGVTVIRHGFSAPAERVAEAAEHGWHCSFAGNLTYPSAEGLRESARLVPDELLLVETDSPFLAPQPVRGRPNQPANVVATAERLAEVRGTDYEQLDRKIEANAAWVFGW